LPAQNIQDLADGLGAAAKNRRVFEIEVLQAAEGRALGPDRLRRLNASLSPELGKASLDQLAQVLFQAVFELRRSFEVIESGGKAAFRVEEPFLKKSFDGSLLFETLDYVLVQNREGLGSLAIDEQIGNPPRLVRIEGIFEFKFGAGRETSSIRPQGAE
jgi:hypothetical protein